MSSRDGSWPAWVAARNEAIAASGRWRTTRALSDGHPTTTLAAGGEPVVSFASNDYLGLSQHPRVVEAAQEALVRYGTGSGASRLVVGTRPAHHELEHAIAEWKGTEAALVFSTGYLANLGVLSAFGSEPDTTILSDELNHASIIDGTRLARAKVGVYGHNDLAHLEALLAPAGRAIVVSDAVFSMDGDVAPVDELVALCRRYGALLVLDEAHAVLGPQSPTGDDVIVVGTLSKTLGAIGGFVAASRACIDLLVNTARTFIFTTAPPPADVAAAHAALNVVRSCDGDERRATLRRHVDRIAPGHPSPIVPLIVGGEAEALAAANAVLARGLLVPAIRPPTVPEGTCRLRVALSAAHTDAQVGQLAAALCDLRLLRIPG